MYSCNAHSCMAIFATRFWPKAPDHEPTHPAQWGHTPPRQGHKPITTNTGHTFTTNTTQREYLPPSHSRDTHLYSGDTLLHKFTLTKQGQSPFLTPTQRGHSPSHSPIGDALLTHTQRVHPLSQPLSGDTLAHTHKEGTSSLTPSYSGETLLTLAKQGHPPTPSYSRTHPLSHLPSRDTLPHPYLAYQYPARISPPPIPSRMGTETPQPGGSQPSCNPTAQYFIQITYCTLYSVQYIVHFMEVKRSVSRSDTVP